MLFSASWNAYNKKVSCLKWEEGNVSTNKTRKHISKWLRLCVNKTMSECDHLLPDEDIVDHGTATEDDTHTNKHASHNGWSGMELDECVQNDACTRKKQIPAVSTDIKKQLLQHFSKWELQSNTIGLSI
jgi:hypothetical protein